VGKRNGTTPIKGTFPFRCRSTNIPREQQTPFSGGRPLKGKSSLGGGDVGTWERTSDGVPEGVFLVVVGGVGRLQGNIEKKGEKGNKFGSIGEYVEGDGCGFRKRKSTTQRSEERIIHLSEGCL